MMSPTDTYRKPLPLLPPNEVHAWWTPVDLPEQSISQLSAYLSDQEKSRARRFIRPLHRRRFTAAHGVLRQVLEFYLKTPGKNIIFKYDRYGKPHLAGAPGPSSLNFNLSHSRQIALFGICMGRKIGVDIEEIRPVTRMESIAQRFFSKAESARILAAPVFLRQKMFFQYWSMKEACLKASGYGLRGLQQIDISCANDRHLSSHEAVDIDDGQTPWSIRSLPVVEGYAAAVAIEGNARWRLVCREWRL